MPGGIGNHAYCLAKELGYLKYSVSVLTEKREDQLGDWENLVNSNQDINIMSIPRKRIVVFTYFLRLWKLYKSINRTSYRAVFYTGKFSVWLNGLMPRTNSIVVVHGSEIKQKGVFKVLFNRGLKRAKYIVCVSNYTKDQLVGQYQNLENQKIIVINNGFKTEFSSDKHVKKDLENNRLRIVTVGGIHKRKGQFNVISALPQIIKNFPETRYNIIGLPLEKDDLVNLIDSKHVHQYVVFHHGLKDREVKDILFESDIFMMLSEHLENGDFEGFGIAILEAMALGLPAIGSRNSGISDAIKDDYSGKLVDPKNTDEIICALEKITDNYELYSKQAKHWADSFQWKYKILEYLSIIDKL